MCCSTPIPLQGSFDPLLGVASIADLLAGTSLFIYQRLWIGMGQSTLARAEAQLAPVPIAPPGLKPIQNPMNAPRTKVRA